MHACTIVFEKMKQGKYKDGQLVLRAKIDMASPNLNMRDPALFRIKHEPHQATGDEWCIYPMYDFSHPIADAVEGITHSLCTLEFEDHRPFYDWVIEKLVPTGLIQAQPQQIEFSRLNIKYVTLICCFAVVCWCFCSCWCLSSRLETSHTTLCLLYSDIRYCPNEN